MYSILVVEDSKSILRNIVFQLQDSGYDLDIRTAFDGDEALKSAETLMPDILLTDIKLPTMDGLTLIRKCKEMSDKIRCVIISGYGDFSFMHQALMLRVDEYLLKPVSPEAFRKMMDKVTSSVDQIVQMDAEEQIHSFLQPGNDARQLNACALPERYLLVLFRAGLYHNHVEPLGKGEIYEALNIQKGVWVSNTETTSEKLLMFDLSKISAESALACSQQAMERLSIRHAPLNAICSGELNCLSQISQQYSLLASRLTALIRLEEPGFYYETSKSPYDRAHMHEMVLAFRKRMELVMRDKDMECFGEEIRKSVLEWEYLQCSVSALRRLLQTLFDLILAAFASDEQSLFADTNIIINRVISESNGYTDLADKICEFSSLFVAAEDEKPTITKSVAEQITQYMRSRIFGNITLQDISDEFGLSVSYICRIIKSCFNDTPMGYYRKLKIEEAERIMLEKKDMRIKEIAEILGFCDQYYFCKVFKQWYGVTPTEFRNKKG